MTVNLAEVLRRFSGPPVNIEAVIRELGLELDKRANLEPTISGQIERLSGGRYKISANRGDHYFRQRFTMAHELGHYLLHQPLIGDGVNDDRAYRSTESGRYHNSSISAVHETAANQLAARLLMPSESVRTAYAKAPSLAALAQQFQVSPSAMSIRLKSLNLDPSCFPRPET